MEEGDDPIGTGGLEVVFKPFDHARWVLLGVEADEVDVTVIEGVVFFGAGRESAALTAGG